MGKDVMDGDAPLPTGGKFRDVVADRVHQMYQATLIQQVDEHGDGHLGCRKQTDRGIGCDKDFFYVRRIVRPISPRMSNCPFQYDSAPPAQAKGNSGMDSTAVEVFHTGPDGIYILHFHTGFRRIGFFCRSEGCNVAQIVRDANGFTRKDRH